jgi:glycine/D-amino acid oxidase-like deaminating enzyme
MNIAVIGAGAFGAMTAIRLAEAGAAVSLFERLPGLMLGATLNANRVHLGFHYPRDTETIRQSIRGYQKFRQEYGRAILPNLSNSYFIASEGSHTSPDEFLAVCRRVGLAHRTIRPDEFQPAVRSVALGVLTDEVMYDPDILRRLMDERLRAAGVTVRVNAAVADIRRLGGGFVIVLGSGVQARFDAVVNCSYADINRLTDRLGHEMEPLQYEYVAVPVIELDWPAPKSITVLDGPFVALLPYGPDGKHLLYHVRHSVIAQAFEKLLDPNWLDPQTSPFAAIDQQRWYETLLKSCCEFIPSVRQGRLTGFVQGPRVVLANRADTDGRPSRVTQHEPGYLTVFSGKIDHCMWVAEEVASALGLGANPAAADLRRTVVQQSTM